MRQAVRALVLSLLLAAGCAAPPGGPPPPPPPASPAPETPTLGQPFALRVGQTATVGPVAVTLAAVTDDSRCPTMVTCVWEGEATAQLEIAVDGQPRGTHALRLAGQNYATAASEAAIDGYTVRFVALEPYPAEPRSIPADEYVARISVEPTPAGYPAVGDGVIVPEQDADAFDPGAEGYWTPGEADVRALEAGLPEFLRAAAAERSPELWQKQGSYKRQYAGLIRDGHRLVYASFFCETHGDEWRRQPMFVMDGGDCYFQLTYDVATGQFGNLMVNGDA